MDLKKIEELLNEFEKLPKNVSDTTFMEICRHSKNRFEEICSRILAFYLQPTNEHGMRDLFLKSLFEVIDDDYKNLYNEQIIIETEAHEDRKSLDLLVIGNSFVLGIENKIGSEVYNPLDVYSRLIDRYKKQKAYKILMSVRKVSKKYELNNIENNGFKIVYYEQLFTSIKDNIGEYYINANPKYITFLFDFIQTIENMMRSTKIDDPQSMFFFDNSSAIEKFTEEYNQHKDRVLRVQKNEIVTLKEQISLKTGVQWKAWQDWDLVYEEFDKKKHTIGIESSYLVQDYDPLKCFRIFITTWNLKDWHYYEEDILRKYPKEKYFLDTKSNNRAYLHMDKIEDNNQDLILEKLTEYYNFVKQVVESKNV